VRKKPEPNDNFISQLVDNAEVHAVDALGILTKKVAVGGHSYGAFMTANLLTHSIFTCGIRAVAPTIGR
jgi:dipeptidyl aminopeptidase/acylaminoacyl peptidase